MEPFLFLILTVVVGLLVASVGQFLLTVSKPKEGKVIDMTEFYTEVSRCADTPEQQIDVADVSRVLAKAFDVLADKDPSYALRVFARGIELASSRRGE